MATTGEAHRAASPSGEADPLENGSTPSGVKPNHPHYSDGTPYAGWYCYSRGICKCDEYCKPAQRKRMARYRANRRQRELVAA